MIRMEHRGGLDCPTVYCDQCKQPIREARHGLYVWDSLNPGEMATVHKGECDRRYEAVAGYGFCGTMELFTLPIYLGNGMNIRWEEAGTLAGHAADA